MAALRHTGAPRPVSGMDASQGEGPKGLPLRLQPGPKGDAPVTPWMIQNLQQQHPEWEESYHSCLQIDVVVSIFPTVGPNLRAAGFQSAVLSEACRQISDRSASDRSSGNNLAKRPRFHYQSYLTVNLCLDVRYGG